MSIRERICRNLDQFYLWVASIVSGIRINKSTFSTCEGSTDSIITKEIRQAIFGHSGRYIGKASPGVREVDMGNESLRTSERGADTGRADECYFIGDRAGYEQVVEALRRQGLEYAAHYYANADDAARHLAARYKTSKKIH